MTVTTLNHLEFALFPFLSQTAASKSSSCLMICFSGGWPLRLRPVRLPLLSSFIGFFLCLLSFSREDERSWV